MSSVENESGTAAATESPRRIRADVLIRRLRFLQAYELRSCRLLGGWLAGIRRWELKHQICLHLWQDAQHSRELRTRLWELRTPNPDRNLPSQIDQVTRQLAAAQYDYEFIVGLYLGLKTRLVDAYEVIVKNTSSIYDAPTVAIVHRLLPEKKAQIDWAREALAALVSSGEARRRVSRWQAYVGAVLDHAGGVAGETASGNSEVPVPPPGYGTNCLPFSHALRDERFTLSLVGMPLPVEKDHEARRLFQFFNYSQEMQAAETLGSMLWETEGMEWEFYYDIARHCYDEERHSALGEKRLEELGHHVSDFPNSVANYAWRQLMDPLRRYCVLTYVIEADSFKYKHQSYQEYLAAGDIESAESVLFDIMDESRP
jgi:hypothetical protein